MVGTALNPRWVRSTLSDRGLPVLDLQAIQYGIEQLDDEQLATVHALVSRLHTGTDQVVDMQEMANWASSWSRAWKENSTESMLVSLTPPAAPPHEMPLKMSHQTKPHRSGLEREDTLHSDRKSQMRQSHHVYGTSAVCCIEPALIEDIGAEWKRPDFHTIAIEIAPNIPGTKHFDWTAKISVRLTRRELPAYAAVLMGIQKSMMAEKHGPANDKSITIDDQGKHLFIKIRQGARTLGVQAQPDDVFALLSMVEEVMLRNTPSLDSQTIVANIKRYGAMEHLKRS